jgi:hypothetical protein
MTQEQRQEAYARCRSRDGGREQQQKKDAQVTDLVQVHVEQLAHLIDHVGAARAAPALSQSIGIDDTRYKLFSIWYWISTSSEQQKLSGRQRGGLNTSAHPISQSTTLSSTVCHTSQWIG